MEERIAKEVKRIRKYIEDEDFFDIVTIANNELSNDLRIYTLQDLNIVYTKLSETVDKIFNHRTASVKEIICMCIYEVLIYEYITSSPLKGGIIKEAAELIDTVAEINNLGSKITIERG